LFLVKKAPGSVGLINIMVNLTSYPSGWIRTGNVFVFDHDWQTPAKTELYAYEKLLAEPQPDAFIQYICFPWATLVDYLDHNQTKAQKLLQGLKQHPPKMSLNIVTFCQHIYALKLLPYFKLLGITDIYWSHKIKGQDEIEGIKLHPYSLYPVMHYKRKSNEKKKPLSERKYLYSFIGSYQEGLYLSPVRKWIFDLPERKDALVIERSEWHFEQDIYRNQLLDMTENEVEMKLRDKYEKEYIETMNDTVYCLCPSGSGPNSIRLYEAIKFGCIPVLLSDSLDIPIDSQFNNLIRVKVTKESLTSFISDICKKYRYQ
jgi:hypothetical protein